MKPPSRTRREPSVSMSCAHTKCGSRARTLRLRESCMVLTPPRPSPSHHTAYEITGRASTRTTWRGGRVAMSRIASARSMQSPTVEHMREARAATEASMSRRGEADRLSARSKASRPSMTEPSNPI